MKRVCVIGPCGAGKSTLAIELGRRTGLPVFHMDRLQWKPGWVESSREELAEKLTPIAEADRWIIDGNYSGTMHLRLPRADTVIFLDYPPRVCRWRVVKRMISNYGRTRPDMNEGCPERFELDFLRYVWRFHRDSRPNILRNLKDTPAGQELHWLRHPRELRALLEQLEATPGPSA